MEELNELDCANSSSEERISSASLVFKKPILVGKIGRLPKKINSSVICKKEENVPNIPQSSEVLLEPEASECVLQDTLENDPVPQQQIEKSVSSLYQEPAWSSLPKSVGKPYVLEVLKSGSIVQEINLMSKSHWVFGRSTSCDIPLAHPTISRFHAVLQYRGVATETDSVGFSIYDIGSTHGTFLNKGRLKSRIYAPVRVGHLIKFGFSSRAFILQGPIEDTEVESIFSITELKQQRAQKLLQQELEDKEALLKKQQQLDENRKKQELRGVDWGLGEDAEEEPDLVENPYAQTNNEELYLEDPKKALRGFMEREGFNLDYDCTEHGFGQFLCKIELPVDDECGRPIVAEVLHKGKKKEAVVQCALEACRILDRHGVLRQATHESRKRKVKNWEENDFYDSDDDTFLDRTGTIEKKREKRMHEKIPQQAETYESLVEKEKKLSVEIIKIEKELSLARNKEGEQSLSTNDEDALDSYMKTLKDTKHNKQTISKLKSTLALLKADLANVITLVSIAKPTNLPQLIVEKPLQSTKVTNTNNLPLYGKRFKSKLKVPVKRLPTESVNEKDMDEDQEEDGINIKCDTKLISKCSFLEADNTLDNKIQENLKGAPPTCQTLLKNKAHTKVLTTQKMANSGSEDDECDDDTRDDKELTVEELKKRQKRNQRRIKQRRDKAEVHKLKGYQEDAQKQDYNMWVPPTNQTGDGRTSLNEKFGY